MTNIAREYIAPIKDGKFPRTTALSIQALLAGLEGKVIKVTIKQHTVKRSVSQNAYYWSVVIPHWKAIFKEYGTLVTDDEVHSFLVVNVGKLVKPMRDPHGELLCGSDGSPWYEARSTSELTTKEFSDFVEACRAEAAAEHGHDIPPPDKNYKQNEEETNG